MAGNYTFIIVGVKDNPVYEAEFGQMARALPGTAADKVRNDRERAKERKER